MTHTNATSRSVAIGIGIVPVLLFLVLVLTLGPFSVLSAVEGQTGSQGAGVPQFEWDPTWPKQPFPNNWVLGMVLGAVVDSQDHLWISHRAGSLTPWEAGASADPPRAGCCTPAPSIIEFDYEGNIVRSWGGSDVTEYDWLEAEHGMTIDHEGNVWVAASSREDSRVLKFTPDGEVLLQIGEQAPPNGSNDTRTLGLPADMSVDAATNEIWIADGYGNKRVIIFDANTGAYKRHFGAYGNRPDDAPFRYDHTTDAPPPQQFILPHCVKFSNDGLVYVCDRETSRIQIFRKDGTFVEEAFVAKEIPGAVVTDLGFSHDATQRFVYVVDHATHKVWILEREGMEVVGSFGQGGHFGGSFTIPHNIAVDSQGNLYVTEGLEGKRVQRFLYTGLRNE